MKRFVYFLCSAFVLSSCSGSTSTEAEVTPSSEQTAAPSTSAEQEEVERTPIELYPGGSFQQRYESYHHAYLVAAGDPYADPDFEPLQELSTERRLKVDKNFLEGLKERGEVLRLPENSVNEHILSEIGGDAVITDPNFVQFQDCYFSDSYIAKKDSPTQTNTPTETILYLVEMKFVDGEWRLNGLAEKAYWEGKGECVQ